jgi:hypothetical protein
MKGAHMWKGLVGVGLLVAVLALASQLLAFDLMPEDARYGIRFMLKSPAGTPILSHQIRPGLPGVLDLREQTVHPEGPVREFWALYALPDGLYAINGLGQRYHVRLEPVP